MYYPQDTTEDMGLTAIVPGTQYYNTSTGGTRDDETPLQVPAGTVAIVNYDIWHRGTANRSQKKRYMMKFLFYCMEEPRGPSWDNEQAEWEGMGSEHNEMWTSIWDWHLGRANGGATRKQRKAERSVDELVRSMVNDPEPACIDAAYELGRLGPDALPAPMTALQADHGEVPSTADTPYGKLAEASRSEEIRRNISYALVAVGAPAVPELIAATEHEDWWVRDTAVEALGDIGLPAREAVLSPIERLEDRSRQVQRHASEALGMAGQTGKGRRARPDRSAAARRRGREAERGPGSGKDRAERPRSRSRVEGCAVGR